MIVSRLVYGFVALLLAVTGAASQEVEYTMTGEYQGKNIYIQNPLSADKINFCTSEVFLNEKLITSSPKTSAFVVDLSGLEIGDPVFLKIVHKEECVPKVINPQVIRSKSSFQYLQVIADDNGIFWSTSGELRSGNYLLEHYRNNSWTMTKQRQKQ